MTQTWWDPNFPFRRHLKITALDEDLPANHPVVVDISAAATVDAGKIKLDSNGNPYNVFVIYTLDETFTPLMSQTTLSSDKSTVQILFNLVNPIAKGDSVTDVYYVYYGSLYSVKSIGTYTPIDWPVTVSATNPEVAYTRPGEQWVNGVSNTTNARATFRFAGNKIQLISNTGDYGIASVQVDAGNPWTNVDLFSPTAASNVVVFEKHGLVIGPHIIRVVVSGKSNPSASNAEINIVSFKYNKDIEATDLGEQTADLKWISYTGSSNS